MTSHSEAIPTEAIEAALAAWGAKGAPWQRRHVSAILEAAAPYIEKKAYERGWGAGFRHTSQAYRAAAERAPYMLNNEGEK